MASTSLNSKYRVNSNGFALFVIGLTLAGFVGGGIRFFLNSNQAQERILNELKVKLPEWQIETDRVRLLLASGIWPGITMVVPKAKLTRQGDCKLARIHVRLEDMRLPLSLWSLLRGHSQLGDASIHKLEVEIDPEVCKNIAMDSLPAKEHSVAGPTSDELQMLGLEKTFDEIRRRIDSLYIENLSLSDVNQPDWSIMATAVRVDVGSWVRGSAKLSLWKRFPQGELRQSFDVGLNLQKSLLDWRIKTAVKEGEFEWFGQLDEAGRTFLQRVSVRQGPVADLFEVMKTAGVTAQTPSIRRAWFNCQISQGGSFRKLRDVKLAPIRIESCVLQGEGGKFSLSPVTFYPREPYFRSEPLEFHAQQVPVQTLADFFGLKWADRVIHDLGRLSGSGQIFSKEKWRLRGELEGLKISLSNDSLRGMETISSTRIHAEKNWDQMSVQLSDFKVPGGGRGGQVHLTFNPKSEEGKIKLNFAALSLSREAQNVLLRGSGDPMKIYGEGRIQKGQITDFQGQLEWPKASGRGWAVEDVSAQFQFRDHVFRSTLAVGRMDWGDSYFYAPFLRQLKERFKIESAPNQMSKIKIMAQILAQGGKVTQAQGAMGEERLSFEGEWIRSGSLTGKVSHTGAKVTVPVELTSRAATLLK